MVRVSYGLRREDDNVRYHYTKVDNNNGSSNNDDYVPPDNVVKKKEDILLRKEHIENIINTKEKRINELRMLVKEYYNNPVKRRELIKKGFKVGKVEKIIKSEGRFIIYYKDDLRKLRQELNDVRRFEQKLKAGVLTPNDLDAYLSYSRKKESRLKDFLREKKNEYKQKKLVERQKRDNLREVIREGGVRVRYSEPVNKVTRGVGIINGNKVKAGVVGNTAFFVTNNKPGPLVIKKDNVTSTGSEGVLYSSSESGVTYSGSYYSPMKTYSSVPYGINNDVVNNELLSNEAPVGVVTEVKPTGSGNPLFNPSIASFLGFKGGKELAIGKSKLKQGDLTGFFNLGKGAFFKFASGFQKSLISAKEDPLTTIGVVGAYTVAGSVGGSPAVAGLFGAQNVVEYTSGREPSVVSMVKNPISSVGSLSPFIAVGGLLSGVKRTSYYDKPVSANELIIKDSKLSTDVIVKPLKKLEVAGVQHISNKGESSIYFASRGVFGKEVVVKGESLSALPKAYSYSLFGERRIMTFRKDNAYNNPEVVISERLSKNGVISRSDINKLVDYKVKIDGFVSDYHSSKKGVVVSKAEVTFNNLVDNPNKAIGLFKDESIPNFVFVKEGNKVIVFEKTKKAGVVDYERALVVKDVNSNSLSKELVNKPLFVVGEHKPVVKNGVAFSGVVSGGSINNNVFSSVLLNKVKPVVIDEVKVNTDNAFFRRETEVLVNNNKFNNNVVSEKPVFVKEHKPVVVNNIGFSFVNSLSSFSSLNSAFLRKSVFDYKSRLDSVNNVKSINKVNSFISNKLLVSSDSVVNTVQAQNNKLMSFNVVNNFNSVNNFNTNFNSVNNVVEKPIKPLISNKKLLGGNTGFYTLEVRKKGKFVPIKDFFNPEKAVVEGKKIVESSAAATFRVKGLKRFSTDLKGFKKRKSNEGLLFVEKKENRINTLGELKEITFNPKKIFKKKKYNKLKL